MPDAATSVDREGGIATTASTSTACKVSLEEESKDEELDHAALDALFDALL